LTGLHLEMGSEAEKVGKNLLDKIAHTLKRHRKTWCRRSLESREKAEAMTLNPGDLEAGYSLFTESIDVLGSLGEFSRSCRKALRRALIRLDVRAHHLKPWSQAVHSDLGAIASSLRKSKTNLAPKN
jgi:hypothetical protein